MKEASLTVERIRLHYKRLGLDQGWTRERMHRLCQLLHWTPHELAAVCCIEPKRMAKWTYDGHFPANVSLLFCLIEGAYLQATCALQGEPVMPLHLLPAPPTPRPRHD